MKKALVIGINAYPGAVLYGCINDATAISELLETNGDGSRNFDVRLEKDIFTKSVLRKKIVKLFSGSCDTALLYFSGHGYVNELGGYIVTPDRKQYDEGILMDEILKLANASKAVNKIIILDCCYSGAMGSPTILGMGASYLSEGVTVICASKQDEQSIELNGQGIFTTLLIEALNGGAADIRGHITPGSIYSFIEQAFGLFDQRPVFKTNTTSFSPLRTIAPLVSIEVLRKINEYFKTPETEYELDPSYEEISTKTPKASDINKNNVTVFEHLRKFQSLGLVVPVDAPYMFYAAINSKSCMLTPLGRHYWRLVKNKRI
jgi:hypothetical protein